MKDSTKDRKCSIDEISDSDRETDHSTDHTQKKEFIFCILSGSKVQSQRPEMQRGWIQGRFKNVQWTSLQRKRVNTLTRHQALSTEKVIREGDETEESTVSEQSHFPCEGTSERSQVRWEVRPCRLISRLDRNAILRVSPNIRKELLRKNVLGHRARVKGRDEREDESLHNGEDVSQNFFLCRNQIIITIFLPNTC